MAQGSMSRQGAVIPEQPEVRHDNGEPDDTWLIEDTLQKLRAVHEIPLRGLSAIQAALVPEKASVWDALGKSETGPGRKVDSSHPRSGGEEGARPPKLWRRRVGR